jgi:hypothetical protein
MSKLPDAIVYALNARITALEYQWIPEFDAKIAEAKRLESARSAAINELVKIKLFLSENERA